ncbi:MAG: bifunctional proline dehydrogenase/L-glutamate gamma-semialdehyde dehydrogenase PutA [Xanthomonadales bacterium]|nr:bifunctional proline dehydrogenase/L-glutamate gamma-semialdehyde dehydrogenase PutA [Xanthomonadales bacterium]
MTKPIVFSDTPPVLEGHRSKLAESCLCNEAEHLELLLSDLELKPRTREEITAMAETLVEKVRAQSEEQSALDQFMSQYDLSSEEGVLLMCVAEALLRIPDSDTAEKLIADKLGSADWESHLGRSQSLFVNASTWGLMLTGRIVRLDEATRGNFRKAMNRLIKNSGEPVIRMAVRQAMRIMGHQFVMGRTIGEALKRSRSGDNRHYRYSFDMLGEAALTAPDAERYFQAYAEAIKSIGSRGPFEDIFAAPSISVKLSALHPRYEPEQRERVMSELVPRLLDLAVLAREQGIALTVDAEEAARLQLSLDVFDAVYSSSKLDGYQGFGLAVQAYQKRAPHVLDWLRERSEAVGRRIPVRLVKGAYWDSEIKHAQELGLEGYPVFTRKANTDLSYLACAKILLGARHAFYPQFATHNAHTLAAVYHLAGEDKTLEFQRLHGMGEELYAEVIDPKRFAMPCRVYAPVGSHEELLPYLVRRLLENGANTSFVNRITDESVPVSEIVSDPVDMVRRTEPKAHPRIPLPPQIYETRRNAKGYDLAYESAQLELAEVMGAHLPGDWQAIPLVPDAPQAGPEIRVLNPADHRQVVGVWRGADAGTVDRAVDNARKAFRGWRDLPVDARAACLDRAADLLEERMGQYLSLAVFEAGKTLGDAISEVREAVDFCRYYALNARHQFWSPISLPGPTGEHNELHQMGRGPFVCVSPWNFPLAIFMGQVTAALVAGNPVIAKPAEQTTLIASYATRLLHEAGVPEDVLQLVPGDGATVGARLVAADGIAGVAFTGSTETAHAINRALAARPGAIGTLIAETGGQNALIADSSALPEQLVADVVVSAFQSAGQRCSALRVLFLQDVIADRVIEMLAGAMDELVVGNPALLRTDVGPVIDADALAILDSHRERMNREARPIRRARLSDETAHGSFFAPAAFELERMDILQREVFGPCLHVVRYRGRELDDVIAAINATGYGLTTGVHSRIEATADYICQNIQAGNCYVNRNIVGAVVGVQPFGGEGLSGTGPKAGGPNYLRRFTTERTVTVNTAAVGGNASLLALD